MLARTKKHSAARSASTSPGCDPDVAYDDDALSLLLSLVSDSFCNALAISDDGSTPLSLKSASCFPAGPSPFARSSEVPSHVDETEP